MEEENAKAILESAGYIDVTYNNRSIWIEYINHQSGTAHIKYFDSENEDEDEVDISELKCTNKTIKGVE